MPKEADASFMKDLSQKLISYGLLKAAVETFSKLGNDVPTKVVHASFSFAEKKLMSAMKRLEKCKPFKIEHDCLNLKNMSDCETALTTVLSSCDDMIQEISKFQIGNGEKELSDLIAKAAELQMKCGWKEDAVKDLLVLLSQQFVQT